MTQRKPCRLTLYSRRPDHMTREEWTLFKQMSALSLDGSSDRQIARELGVPLQLVKQLMCPTSEEVTRRHWLARFKEDQIDASQYANA